jgi:hypothetical protein
MQASSPMHRLPLRATRLSTTRVVERTMSIRRRYVRCKALRRAAVAMVQVVTILQ